MKLTIPALGVLTVIVAMASIGVFYTASYQSQAGAPESFTGGSAVPGAAFLVGNVKVTQFDENQNVIAIRQGSNHITATGMSIIMGQVFEGVNATYPDQAPAGKNNVTGTVGWMEIGIEGDPVTYTNELRWNNTNIIAPVADTVPGCIRVAATINNNTQGPAHKAGSFCDAKVGTGRTDCNARMNVTATSQFDGALCSENGIDEAGIFTTPTTDDRGLLFARNTFGSVNLGPLDTLQLEWEFTFRDS